MSRMNNVFTAIQLRKPQRAKFDLSHERKMSIAFGALIPTMVEEVLPGDSFDVNTNILARFQAMLAPPMHRVNVFTHYFYVPYPVINRQFKRFINYQGNRPNNSTTASQAPFVTINEMRTAIVNGVAGAALRDCSLMDYLKFPTAPNDVTFNAGAAWYQGLRIAAWWPLAYQRIWNDFYRDQNFTQPLFSDDATGPLDQNTAYLFDAVTNFQQATTCPDPETTSTLLNSNVVSELLKLRWRAWEKDYLTSALPYANQGIGDPRVPITVPAGALGNTTAVGTPTPGANATFGRTGGIQYPGSVNNPTDQGGFTLSALRIASALKRYLETSARSGVRYAEALWSRWFVKSDDQSLQQAQYLGGGVQPMVISEVVTQAPATETQPNNPAGYLAGHGISYGATNKFRKTFKEHGVVMAITSIIPRTAYLYSLPRAYMRTEPLDFATPEFAQIGEQPVLGAEVFFKLDITAASAMAPNYSAAAPNQGYIGAVNRYSMGYIAPAPYTGFDIQNDNPEGSVLANSIWGFQGRYSEYKYSPDTCHGLFRSNLSFWHFGRMLSPGQALNNSFVTSNPRMDMFAVLPSTGGVGQYFQHPILLNVYNRVSVIRSLPYFNQPSLF